jgi:hypothetical protein
MPASSPRRKAPPGRLGRLAQRVACRIGGVSPISIGATDLGWVAEWFKAAVLKTAVGSRPPWVRIPPHPPVRNCERRAWPVSHRRQRLEQIALRADDADRFVRDLDALGERTEMVAAIAPAVDPDPLSRRPGEPLDHLGRDRLLA